MNKNMTRAKTNKNDEYYTRYEDIDKEVGFYWRHLRGQVVYCNTDNYKHSNFVKYFIDNFDNIGIKKLISLDIDGNYFEYDGNTEQVYKFETGDFREQYSTSILENVDVVITNPPFSLFRSFIQQLITYDKKFLIIGNFNAITYMDVFSLFQNNKVWIGVQPRSMSFITEDNNFKTVNAVWFTNLKHTQRNKYIKLHKKYDKDEYIAYDNYDAIEVSRVADIPLDYRGVMGVPITFLDKYNPDQFEIVGITDRHNSSGLKTKIYTEKDHKNYCDLNRRSVSLLPDGSFKHYYVRVLIKHKMYVS